MPPYSYRTRVVGRSATPTSEHAKVNTIAGTSLDIGDADDATHSTITSSGEQEVGWSDESSNVDRRRAVHYLPLPVDIRRGARVISAVYAKHVIGSTWLSNLIDGGSVTVEGYAIRRTLSSSLAGLTWANYTTGQAWARLGIKLGVGPDVDPTPFITFSWDQDDHDAAPSASDPVIKLLAMRAEIQRLLDFDEPLQFVLVETWDNTGVGDLTATHKVIKMNQPSGSPSTIHDYLTVGYRNPIEIYGMLSGQPNQGDLKDVASASIDQHLFLGTPPLGAASVATPYAGRNETTSTQPAVSIITDRAQVGSVSETVAGSGHMRWLEVFDTATGQGTPACTLRLTFSAATTCAASIRLDGATAFVTTGLAGHTGIDITSDALITYNGDDAFQLRADAFTGTFANLDVVEVEIRADAHSSAAPLASLDDVRLAPHDVGDRTTALTTSPRVASRMRTVQLYRHDSAVIANSGDATGAIGNVTDGAHTGTHLKLPYTGWFTADDYCTLATATAHDEPETGPVRRVVHSRIKTIYAMDHATYPGQILLYDTVATPGDFDGNSLFTTGVWLGKLEVSNQAFLASTASTLSPTIHLDATPTRTSGTITLFDLLTGTKEQRVIDEVVGTAVTLTASPSYAYPTGSLVWFEDETTSWVPFFAWAEPPVSTARGRKLGYVAGVSWAIT
jgi:hypothetical protein